MERSYLEERKPPDYNLLQDGDYLESRDLSLVEKDKQFKKVYQYFFKRGFVNGVIDSGLQILAFTWIYILTVVLVCYVDFGKLLSDTNLSSAWGFKGMPIWLITCSICYWLGWAFIVWGFIGQVRDLREMKVFYETKLQIDEEELQTIFWVDVVRRLEQHMHNSYNRTKSLSPLDIANHIMREDNYLIAMINEDVLNLSFSIPYVYSGTQSGRWMTKILEWVVRSCISSIFFEKGLLNRKAINSNTSAKDLRKKFRTAGFLMLVISPILVLFVLIYFLFIYGQEIYTKPGSVLGMRGWSSYARWKFREFNELPHDFSERLKAAILPAQFYVNSFPSLIVTITARFVSIILGSVAVVLIVVGLLNDAILLEANFFGRSGVWLLGILVTGATVARSLIPPPGERNPKFWMEKVVENTHYFPAEWKRNTHTMAVFTEFSHLFQLKIMTFFSEIFSVLTAPYILLFSLPKCSHNVLLFFQKNTTEDKFVGDICTFATFKLKSTQPKTPSDSLSIRVDAVDFPFQNNEGKMEKSMIGFKARNPEWEPDDEAKEFIGNVEKQAQVDFSSPQSSQFQEDTAAKDWIALSSSRRMLEKSVISINHVYRKWYEENS